MADVGSAGGAFGNVVMSSGQQGGGGLGHGAQHGQRGGGGQVQSCCLYARTTRKLNERLLIPVLVSYRLQYALYT